jgi:predicted alpha/beta hydrolase family esterase
MIFSALNLPVVAKARLPMTGPCRRRRRIPLPLARIASASDPYGSIEYADGRASQWGSGIVEVGELGHINNEASGLGDWPQGKTLLMVFAAGLRIDVPSAFGEA